MVVPHEDTHGNSFGSYVSTNFLTRSDLAMHVWYCLVSKFNTPLLNNASFNTLLLVHCVGYIIKSNEFNTPCWKRDILVILIIYKFIYVFDLDASMNLSTTCISSKAPDSFLPCTSPGSPQRASESLRNPDAEAFFSNLNGSVEPSRTRRGFFAFEATIQLRI
jgi:hypothetical protein